jgi:Zn ribbon nucleic-acid-binding protein
MGTDLLVEIAEAAEMLCDPRSHREPRWTWDEHRNRKPLDPHITTVPGLIQQLRHVAEPGNDGADGGRGGRESVPVAIDAVSLLSSIGHGSAQRIIDAIRGGHRIDQRPDPEGRIRALVGIAATLPANRTRVDPYTCPTCFAGADREHWVPCHRCQPTTQAELARELRSWQWQAEIITGWRTPPRELAAPCPNCEAKGTLLAYAHPDNPSARCVGCGAQWSQEPGPGQGHIGVLSQHVIDYTDRARRQNTEARTRAVAERQRREGKPAA